MSAVVCGLGQGLTHQGAGADHAVEAGQRDHLDNGRHATAFFANHPGQGAAKLHFTGGVRPVTQLVFQALDIELVARAVRAMARQQKAGQALGGVCQGQEGIAHRRRAEPLVADQLISLTGTTQTYRVGTGGVGAHIGTALLLGHGHADGRAGFLLDRQIARVVLGGEDFRQPLLGHIGLQLERGHAGEGHGQRAAAAGFGLAVQIAHGGARDLSAGARIGPGHGRQTMLDGRTHQLVISRVKLHQIGAMAIAVVAFEHRLVFIGEKACGHQLTTRQAAIHIQALLGPAAAEALAPLLQRQIDAVQVGAIQRRHLIEHFMGFGVLAGIHG